MLQTSISKHRMTNSCVRDNAFRYCRAGRQAGWRDKKSVKHESVLRSNLFWCDSRHQANSVSLLVQHHCQLFDNK